MSGSLALAASILRTQKRRCRKDSAVVVRLPDFSRGISLVRPITAGIVPAVQPKVVEAEGVEPSSQAAKTQASTSIANNLVFAHRTPIGGLPAARSSLCVRIARKAMAMRKPAFCYARAVSAGGRRANGPLESGAVAT